MKNLLPLLATAMLFSACEKSPDVIAETSSAITFKSSITPETRVESDQFEAGDKIFVTAYDGTSVYADKAAYVHNGVAFSSSAPISYESETQELSFMAAYPAVDDFAKSFTFELLADQSSGDNFEMSDLLIATQDATSELCPTLTFSHTLSNLVVNISDTSLAGGVLKVFAASEALIDVDSKSYTASGSTAEFTAAANGDASYKLIMAPQTISAGDVIATYTVDGMTYRWVATFDLTVNTGCRYTYSWDLTKNVVTYEGSIEGWSYESLNGEGYVESYNLADFSASTFPITTDTWVINDTTATSTDFAGLNAALRSIASSGREISLEFPNLEAIPDYAIFGVSTLDADAFDTFNAEVLVSVLADVATSVGAYAFYNCSSLREVNFPMASTLYKYAISRCTSLTYVELPSAKTVVDRLFYYSTSLETVKMPVITYINATYVFFGCSALKYLELATEDGAVLEYINIILFNWSSTTSATAANVNLTVGAANAELVSGSTLYVGDNNFTFASITVLE